MRRDIRFRGKRIDNGEWIYGSLLDGDIIVAGPVDADEDYIGLGEWSSVDPETVGQYTGLKDRNGVDIYEGDSVEYLCEGDGYDWVECGTVSWDEELLQYDLNSHRDKLDSDVVDNVWVIGNRWDNPDLLEG